MGMDPGTALLVGSLVQGGLGLAGGLTAPEGQKLSSFEGTGADPTKLMESLLGSLNKHKTLLEDELGKGISLPSAYVQDLPTFTGGGLPMSIGVTGRDPALNDRSLLTKPGIRYATPDNLAGTTKGTKFTPYGPNDPAPTTTVPRADTKGNKFTPYGPLDATAPSAVPLPDLPLDMAGDPYDVDRGIAAAKLALMGLGG